MSENYDMRVGIWIHKDFQDTKYTDREGKSVSLIPTKATKKAACYDLRAAEDVPVYGKHKAKIRTGLLMLIQPGWEGLIRSRSGLASKVGVFVINSPGTIDEDYVDEIAVNLYNTGDLRFAIQAGDRIAQICFKPKYETEFYRLGTAPEQITDRIGGHGSTGV